MINRRPGFPAFLACLAVIICLMLKVPLAAASAPSCNLGGQRDRDPLCVEVPDNGNMGVFVWEEETPGQSQWAYQPRYFDGYCWGTVLFFVRDGYTYTLYADCFQDYFYADVTECQMSAQSHDVLPDGSSVISLFTHPACPAFCMTQTITCHPGSNLVTKRWQITVTEGTLSSLTILHGGDLVHPLVWGEEGRFTSRTDGSMVFSSMHFPQPRQAVFRADPASPWTLCYGGLWEDGLEQVVGNQLAGLEITADPLHDAGCFVGWNRTLLSAGETWTITTTEDYAPQANPTPTTQPAVTTVPGPSTNPVPDPQPSVPVTPAPTRTPDPQPSVSATPEPVPSLDPEPNVTTTPDPGPTPVLSPVLSVTPVPDPTYEPHPSFIPSDDPSPQPEESDVQKPPAASLSPAGEATPVVSGEDPDLVKTGEAASYSWLLWPVLCLLLGVLIGLRSLYRRKN